MEVHGGRPRPRISPGGATKLTAVWERRCWVARSGRAAPRNALSSMVSEEDTREQTDCAVLDLRLRKELERARACPAKDAGVLPLLAPLGPPPPGVTGPGRRV